MAARLGNVIYWFSLGIAMPTGIFAAVMFYAWFRHDFDDWLSRAVFLQAGAVSFATFLIGRAARYILAGRQIKLTTTIKEPTGPSTPSQ
jgi:hypothetical protein